VKEKGGKREFYKAYLFYVMSLDMEADSASWKLLFLEGRALMRSEQSQRQKEDT
jgi:hypothetical protein